MSTLLHPSKALFQGETPFPVIPCCDHYAGSEKLMRKALQLQDEIGPVFDITCDCEDGAPAGQEKSHAEMVVRVLNSDANRHRMAGVRIHDYTHPHWRSDLDIVINGAGPVISYITLPKACGVGDVAAQIDYLRQRLDTRGLRREIPVHALIETHGALKDAFAIAALPWVRGLDFGLMDFVSAHYGAVPASAMRSPGQFEHRLLVRAKTETVAAALAHGRVPAHNVTLDVKNADATHRDAKRAREEFGFLRMWSIHPSQIRAIVDAMKPDHAEVEDAAAILLMAQKAAWGPIQYKGELQDRATYRYYWEILQKARVTGVEIPADAIQAFFPAA